MARTTETTQERLPMRRPAGGTAAPAAEVIPAERAPTHLAAPVGRDPAGPLAVPTVEGEGVPVVRNAQLSETQRATLLAPADEALIDVLPTGELYLPQVEYRRRLFAAFGPGGWGLEALTPPKVQGNYVGQEWGLVVGDRLVARAWGEQEYLANNPRVSWFTAIESAKSNALMRTCKDLGIAAELWDKRFAQAWQAEHCVRVWVNEGDEHQPKWKPYWRRKDGRPFTNRKGEVIEKGVVAAKATPLARPQATDPKPAPPPPEEPPPPDDDGPEDMAATMRGETAAAEWAQLITAAELRQVFARMGKRLTETDLRTIVWDRYACESLRAIPRRAMTPEDGAHDVLAWLLRWAETGTAPPPRSHARVVRSGRR